jgi:tRNA acetyltransferase TAN1
MKNFNLLVSSPRYNETNAKTELWFTLVICDDPYPIISDLEFQGLITAKTSKNEFEIIEKIKNILAQEPYFFKYVLKIVPIQFVCEANLKQIESMVKENYSNYISNGERFRIKLRRRKNKLIERKPLIESVAKYINNPVDLENPEKIVRIELLKNICGISFLNPGEVISPKNEFMESESES